MKPCLIMFLFAAFCNNLSAQLSIGPDAYLSYARSNFHLSGEKYKWNDAYQLFEADNVLLNKYVKFRRAKRTAKYFGALTLIELAGSLTLIAIGNANSKNYDSVTGEFLIGYATLLILVPVTGTIALSTEAVSLSRRKKLESMFNSHHGLERKDLNSEVYLGIGLSQNGLGLVLQF